MTTSRVPAGRSVVVEVPATTANLGPGFDTLGLALSVYDVLTVTASDRPGARVEVHGVGAGEVPTDESNLVVQAILRVFAEVGEEPPGLDLVARNTIPHGRGLGSSGAAVVSGIVAASGLLAGLVDLDGDRLLLGSHVTVGPRAIVHYGTDLGDGVVVTPDAFVMKGERAEPGTVWRGNPARPCPVAD